MPRQNPPDLFRLPAVVLFFIGLLDLLRGVMHTVLLQWSATHVAQLPAEGSSSDALFLLGVFGISNLLTGFLFLLISWKARELSPYVLILIPLTYLLGLLGIWSGGIHGDAAFNGRYFMFVYFGICIATFVAFLFQKIRRGRATPEV